MIHISTMNDLSQIRDDRSYGVKPIDSSQYVPMKLWNMPMKMIWLIMISICSFLTSRKRATSWTLERLKNPPKLD